MAFTIVRNGAHTGEANTHGTIGTGVDRSPERLKPAAVSHSVFTQHGLIERIAEAASVAFAAYRTARERAQLARLDERALNDIGISRAQADYEAGRAIWDLPTDAINRTSPAGTRRRHATAALAPRRK